MRKFLGSEWSHHSECIRRSQQNKRLSSYRNSGESFLVLIGRPGLFVLHNVPSFSAIIRKNI